MAFKDLRTEQLEYLITLLDKDRTAERLKLTPWERGLHFVIYCFFCLVPIIAPLFIVSEEAHKILITSAVRPIIGVTLVVCVLDLRRLILVFKLGMGKAYLTIGQSSTRVALMTFALILGFFFSFVLGFIAAFAGQGSSWQKYVADSFLALPTLCVIYLLWVNRMCLNRLADIDLLKDELLHRQSASRT